MSQLSAIEIANWIALYAATGLCCAIAMVLSVVITIVNTVKSGELRDLRLPKNLLLCLPRLWWRWQKLYLLSTPVTLAIVAYFATSLSWR